MVCLSLTSHAESPGRRVVWEKCNTTLKVLNIPGSFPVRSVLQPPFQGSNQQRDEWWNFYSSWLGVLFLNANPFEYLFNSGLVLNSINISIPGALNPVNPPKL